MSTNDIVPVTEVVELLNDYWDTDNVSKPNIIEINDIEDPRIREDLENEGDFVSVRMDNPSIDETPIGNHTYGTREYNLIIEVWTSEGRQRMWDMQREVRRICHARRHLMTNFQRILFRDMGEYDPETIQNIWGGQIRIILQNAGTLLETT